MQKCEISDKKRAVLNHILKIGRSLVGIGLLLFGMFADIPAQAATRYEVGIATAATLLRMSDATLNSRLNDIHNLGTTWIRVDFSWPVIQPDNSGVYHWSMYDRVVKAAGAHQLKVLAVLDYTPKWAVEPVCAKLVITEAAATKCEPLSVTTFARFAREAAIHYRHLPVRAWELWNEPNLSSYWKVAQANKSVWSSPLSYARLANAAALQIRQNDPGSLIITGGLAPLFEAVYPKGYQQGDFLARILPHLNPRLFDGVGIHPYSWPVLPSKAAVYNAFYTIDHGSPQYNLQTIMTNAGWGKKQIWATEFGAPTVGTSQVTKPTTTSRPDHVTESVQAQIIVQGVVQWYAQANAGPMFIQSDSDRWLPDVKNEDGFGLRREDGSAKPAYNALKKAEKQINPQMPL